jgi:hypothetical protein
LWVVACASQHGPPPLVILPPLRRRRDRPYEVQVRRGREIILGWASVATAAPGAHPSNHPSWIVPDLRSCERRRCCELRPRCRVGRRGAAGVKRRVTPAPWANAGARRPAALTIGARPMQASATFFCAVSLCTASRSQGRVGGYSEGASAMGPVRAARTLPRLLFTRNSRAPALSRRHRLARAAAEDRPRRSTSHLIMRKRRLMVVPVLPLAFGVSSST